MPLNNSANSNGKTNGANRDFSAPWDQVAGECGNMSRSIAHLNIEVMTLASRRAKAYLDLPSQFAACRQPQDFLALQMSFWQTGIQHYASAMRRMAQYTPGIPLVTGIDETLSDPETADLKSTAGPIERDRITLPDKPPASFDAEEAVAAGQEHQRQASAA